MTKPFAWVDGQPYLITNFILLAAFYFVPIGIYAVFARLARRDFLGLRDGGRF